MDLHFSIKESKIAQIWAKAVKNSAASGLREKNRFDNFPGHSKSTQQALLEELDALCVRLAHLHPELEFPKLDRENLQSSVNTLHYEFAHGHHVTQLFNSENRADWERFNVILHAIESTLTSDSLSKTGLEAIASIVFTWNDSNRVEIPDDCYSDHTLLRSFGSVYANYAQVGRHFVEMFLSQDDSLADEHIQPARWIGGDTRIWLGPTNGHATALKNMRHLEKWFHARSDRFNKLGHFWGDPRLSLGVIPVGRLEHHCETPSEINDLVRKISLFDTVVCVSVI